MTCTRIPAFWGTLVACLLAATSSPAAMITVAEWTFETSPPADLTDSTSIGGIAADSGSGTASGVHASSATDWSTPAGNGSAESLNSNNWGIGDYYQFQVATTGLHQIQFSWHQARNSTGASSFDLQYSTDGSSFSTFSSYSVPVITWVSGSPDETNTTVFSEDLSSITAVNDAPAVYFRLTATPPPAGSTGGFNRVDNIVVQGTETPEPATLALCSIAVIGLAISLLLRRN